MSSLKPNWVHLCNAVKDGRCCDLLAVVGKLDIYYAHAIKAYIVRRDDVMTTNFASVNALRNEALRCPNEYPGIVAAIDMGALERTTSLT